jgi:polysaccharide chain length determinant protein (PEP-CTERM system associated)
MWSGRQFSLRDYWLIVRRRRWLLMLPCAIVFLGVAVWCSTLPDLYRASTVILVEAQKVPENYIKATVSSTVRERLRTLIQQIKSRTRLEQIIEELHLVDDLQNQKAMNTYVKKMLRHIDIEVKGHDAFTVSYLGEEPHNVMLVTNKLASLFIEENLKVREQQVVGTTEFLEHELQRVRTLLEEQEQAISGYKVQYLDELPGRQEINRQTLERLRALLQTNIVTLEQVRSKKSFLTQQLLTLKTDETLRAVLLAAGGQPVGSLEQQLAQRRSVLAELQSRFTDKYPDVQRVKQEIAQLEAQLTGPAPRQPGPSSRAVSGSPLGRLQEQQQRLQNSMQAEIRQIDIQEQRLEQEQADIRQQIPEYEQKVTHAVLREQELAVLTRDYESTRKNYETLLAGHMQAKSAENLERRQKSEQFRVLDPAPLPLKPWKPNRLGILMMGLALGVAVGGGAVYLAEYLDRSIRDPEDLKQISGLPVLATIPLVLTTAAQRRQRLQQWSFYAACMIIPMTALVAVYLFWGKSEMLFASLIPLFKP